MPVQARLSIWDALAVSKAPQGSDEISELSKTIETESGFVRARAGVCLGACNLTMNLFWWRDFFNAGKFCRDMNDSCPFEEHLPFKGNVVKEL